ncbi:MAG: ABC transporter ATP-binding protein [Bacteroidota bacterium]
MKQFFRLIFYAKPYWIYVVLNLISNILFSIFSLVSLSMITPFLFVLFEKVTIVSTKPEFGWSGEAIKNYFSFQMSNVITTQGKFQALLIVAIIFIVFSFASNFFRYLGMYFMSPLRNGVVRDIRKEVYDKLLILPLSFYSRVKTGDIMSRVSSDVHEVEWSIMSTMQLLLREPLMILLFVISLVVISAKLTLFALILLPVSGLLIAFIGKKIKKRSAGGQQALGSISATFEETISGLRIIKGFNVINIASDKFHDQNRGYTKIMNIVFRNTELAGPLTETLGIITLLIIVWFGGNVVLSNPEELSADVLILFVLLFARIISPVQSFISATYSIQKGIAAGARIFEILDSEEVVVEQKEPRTIQRIQDKIEFINVCFNYDSEPILQDINLTVLKGDTIAIVGPSGAGKSTMMDLLPRFYDTTSGNLLVDGINVKEYKISDIRGLMGIVNQDVTLFNDTIFNNIAFGMPNISHQDVEKAAKNANAYEFIVDMPDGFETMIGDRGARLSGGQRQRISIARALLKNPSILIFDEATSALDSESELVVQEAIDNMMKERTTFIIAHRLSTIRKADKIIVLDAGKIIEIGSHDDLMIQNGKYKEMVDKQNFLGHGAF